MKYQKNFVSLAATMICCGLWGAQHQASADWQASARVNTEAQFDDNPLLLPSGKESVFGVTVAPDLGLSWGSSFTRFSLQGGATYDKFSGNGRAQGGKSDDLDSFGQHVSGGFTTQDDRNTLSVNGGFINQTTRTSEIEDTGIVVTGEYKRTYNGSLSYSWRATDVDSFDISANGSNVSYTTDLLTGYDRYGGSLGYRRTISPLDDVGFSLGYSKTEYDSNIVGGTIVGGGTDDLATAKLTWDRKLATGLSVTATPDQAREEGTLDLSLGIGGQMLRKSRPAATEDTVYGLFFELRVDIPLTERDGLSINARNALEPSAVGDTVRRSSVSGRFSHRFTREVTGELSALVLNSESTGDQTGDRFYYEVGPKIGWEFLPNWNLSARYRYRAQYADPDDRHAASNAVFVALTYRLPSFPLF